MPSTNPPAWGDRAADPALRTRGHAKPPILTRAALHALCLASLALILYGALAPLTNRPWLAAPAQWRLLPPAAPSDANDLLTNALVYLPVGVCLRLLLRRRGRAGWTDFVLAALLAAALSYLTELLQQCMPARVSSQTDLLVNTSAAVVGAALAAPLQAALRALHAALFALLHARTAAWTAFVWVFTLTALVMMTSPWILHRPRLNLALDVPLTAADPLWFLRAALFGALAFVLAGREILRTGPRALATAHAIALAASLAALLEFVQSAIAGHHASLIQILIAATGALLGGALAGMWVGPHWPAPPTDSRRRAFRILCGLAVLAAAVYAVFTSVDFGRATLRSEPQFEWIPFRAHFGVSFARALADLAQQSVCYGLVAVACLFVGGRRGRPAALLALLALVGARELAQAWIVGPSADTTSLLLAVLAWFIVGRIARALLPASNRPDRSAPSDPRGLSTASDRRDLRDPAATQPSTSRFVIEAT